MMATKWTCGIYSIFQINMYETITVSENYLIIFFYQMIHYIETNSLTASKFFSLTINFPWLRVVYLPGLWKTSKKPLKAHKKQSLMGKYIVQGQLFWYYVCSHKDRFLYHETLMSLLLPLFIVVSKNVIYLSINKCIPQVCDKLVKDIINFMPLATIISSSNALYIILSSKRNNFTAWRKNSCWSPWLYWKIIIVSFENSNLIIPPSSKLSAVNYLTIK